MPEGEQVKFSDGLVEKTMDCARKYYATITTGNIWTTDAVYRETKNKIKVMCGLGCVGVDMELSALMAVAQYRKVDFMQFLIADDLVPPKSIRRKAEIRSTGKYLNLALDILNIL